MSDVCVRHVGSTGTQDRVRFLVFGGAAHEVRWVHRRGDLAWTSDAYVSRQVIPEPPSGTVVGLGLRRSFRELRMAVLDFINSHPRADVGEVALGLGLRLEEASRICKSLLTDGYLAYDV